MLSGLKNGDAEFTVCRSTLYNKGVLYTDGNLKKLPKSNVNENVLGHKGASSKDFSGAK